MEISNIEKCEFELSVYKKQYKYCDESIQNGSWEGYSESLKVRKEQLEILKEIIKAFELKLKRLKNQTNGQKET
jgi:flagellar biosynthesis/type III secretory pathway protein FliH